MGVDKTEPAGNDGRRAVIWRNRNILCFAALSESSPPTGQSFIHGDKMCMSQYMKLKGLRSGSPVQTYIRETHAVIKRYELVPNVPENTP